MKTMVPLNQTKLYTEDWIGLKQLDQVSQDVYVYVYVYVYVWAGKLEFLSMSGPGSWSLCLCLSRVAGVYVYV